MRKTLGLDQPLYLQYWLFLSKALRGDLGRSLYYKEPALRIILEHMPATAELTFAALLVSLAVAVPMGIVSAVRRDTVWDYAGMLLATIGQATPVFWLGLMFILLFSVQWTVLPSSGRGGIDNLLMPAVTLGAPLMALVTRLVRSGMLDILGEDYIRTARAKGLPNPAVVYRHALRNMLDSPHHGRRPAVGSSPGRCSHHGDDLCLCPVSGGWWSQRSRREIIRWSRRPRYWSPSISWESTSSLMCCMFISIREFVLRRVRR